LLHPDFVPKIYVISGSFRANLAKFVTAGHDDIAGRFGSTVIDRAVQVVVTHVRDEIYSTKRSFLLSPQHHSSPAILCAQSRQQPHGIAVRNGGEIRWRQKLPQLFDLITPLGPWLARSYIISDVEQFTRRGAASSPNLKCD
jgi:hypothetical protein